MNPAVADAGYLYRNGHARCGGCGLEEEPVAGGKRERKHEGWTYDRAHGLGWVCPACRRWVRDATPSSGPSVPDAGPSAPLYDPEPVRGFGLRALSRGLETLRSGRPPSSSRRYRQRVKRRYVAAVAADTDQPIPLERPRISFEAALDYLTRRELTR